MKQLTAVQAAGLPNRFAPITAGRGWYAHARLLSRMVAILLIALIFVQSFQDGVRGQDLGANPATPKDPAFKPSTVFEKDAVKPDALFLRDRDGFLVYDPELTFEKLQQLLRERNATKAQGFPDYAFERVSISAKIRDSDQIADLDFSINVRLSEGAPSAVAVPLSLGNLSVVTNASESSGKDSQMVLAGDQPGYVWWIERDARREYRLQFKARTKIFRSGREGMLRLELPVAPTSIHLEMPAKDQEIQLTPSGGELITVKDDGDRSIAEVECRGGLLTIAWQRKLAFETREAIDVESQTRLSLDARGSLWQGNSTFKLKRSVVTNPRELHIILPENAVWLPDSETAGRIRAVSGGDSNADIISISSGPSTGKTAQHLLLSFPAQTTPVTEELTVFWEWNPPLQDTNNISMRGVMVENVQSHRGTWDLAIPAPYRLGWKTEPGVVFQQISRPAGLGDRLQYEFQFDRQDFQIEAQIQRDDPAVHIRPKFDVTLFKDRTELYGRLEFPVDPIEIPEIQLRAPQWTVVGIEEEATGRSIEFERLEDGSVRPLLSSLLAEESPLVNRSANDLKSSYTWQIKAVQLRDATSALTVQIVIPEVTSLDASGKVTVREYGTGTLSIATVGNLALDESTVTTAGLIPDSRVPQSLLLQLAQTDPAHFRYYQMQSGATRPQWDAHLLIEKSYALMDARFAIRANSDEITTEQNWHVQVENGPLPRIPILVSRNLLDADMLGDGTITVSLNRSIVAWHRVAATREQDLPEGWDSLEWATIELDVSAIPKTFEIQVECRLPVSWDNGPVLRQNIPLAWPQLPVTERPFYTDNTTRVIVDKSLEGRFQLGGPNRDELLVSGTSSPFRLPWNTRVIPCELQRLETLTHNRVSVDRIWVQSILNAQERRDRIAIHFKTDLSIVHLKLEDPTTALPETILLDGKPIDKSVYNSDRHLHIEVAPANAGRNEHVIELWLRSRRYRDWFETASLNLPRLQNASQDAAIYWQVVLPPSEHLVGNNGFAIPEYRWTWKSLLWQRESLLTQADLELWSGASAQVPMPKNTNQYVVSGLGTNASMQIWIAPRWLIWLPVAGLALLAGFLGTNIRWFRQPHVLIAVGVLTLWLSTVYSDLALMCIQLVLLVCAILLSIVWIRYLIFMIWPGRSVFANVSVAPSVWHPEDRSTEEEKTKPMQPRESSSVKGAV